MVTFLLARLHHQRLHGSQHTPLGIRCPRCMLEYFAEGRIESPAPILDAAELTLAEECPDHAERITIDETWARATLS